MAVVYWEVDDPRTALQEFAQFNDSFDEWLKERVLAEFSAGQD